LGGKEEGGEYTWAEMIALNSYTLADAMLEQREKP
jgi:hypothetical protein